MIPLVLILALAIGRWWAVPLLAVGWALVLAIASTDCSVPCVEGGAGLAAINAAVGIALRMLIDVVAGARLKKPSGTTAAHLRQ